MGDQIAAQTLILNGLGEHFAVLDPSLNPDIDDIWTNYVAKGDTFLVAYDGRDLVATGALIKEAVHTGRIVRMSVDPVLRRRGIGRLLVYELLALAKTAGYSRVLVETNDDWYGAIQLYKQCGFKAYDHRDGEIHMALELT